MRKTLFLLVLMATQGAWAWTGSGTNRDPYLIQSFEDWYTLVDGVKKGNTFSGIYFRMTSDVDTHGLSVGDDELYFSGIFDGDGHTLTFNLGTYEEPVGVICAPFAVVSGATINHLTTTGTVYTDAKFAAGIVSRVASGKATRLFDCHSTSVINSAVEGDGTHGGLVADVNIGVDSLVIERCTFTGRLANVAVHNTTHCGGFVGWGASPIVIRHALFDQIDKDYAGTIREGSTFARMDNGVSLTLEQCYTTSQFSTRQGTFITDQVIGPDDLEWEFVGEPDVRLYGKGYYTTGCYVSLTMPEGTKFDHWECDGFISDPWTANGIHQLRDLNHTPILGISTRPIPEAETARVMWGVNYRYLSRLDYHYFVSDEECEARGWKFESGDSDANLVVYDNDGKASEITAVTGYVESSYNNDGVQIHNDLVGDWRNHTHLGLIAPHAFQNSKALETLYFKDTDANNYNTLLPFDFFIGEGAFEGCTNFKELKMMQYTTRGSNHWEALTPGQVNSIADDAFEGCDKLKISVHNGQYQDFLSSPIWKAHQNRFIIYEATTTDFTEKGVMYHWYRNAQETDALKNDDSGMSQMMDQIRTWNADYQNFSAASLLETHSGNVYYTSVIGVDNDVIDDLGGTMRIYNDPGEYYNYKTIQLQRDAITGNEHVKHIEFWQTNGRSENSFSDLKFVIPNGAFKGCTNLKELRLFYYVEDGEDRWETLGPKDVIPGDNIFGFDPNEIPTDIFEPYLPEGFKILVSPDLYQQFIKDSNWRHYLTAIEPVDFEPTAKKKDFTEGGITYSYMTSPGGIVQTSQVVSQDVSWWTAPRIAAEVLPFLVAVGGQGTLINLANTVRQFFSDNLWRGISDETQDLLLDVAWNQFYANVELGLAMDYNLVTIGNNLDKLSYFSENATTAACISKACWGGENSYDIDLLNKGMRQNILSNIHQVGLVGGAHIITTPTKNLVYHTYVKTVSDNTTDAVIYAGKKEDSNESNRVMTFAKDAFQNKTNLKKVRFHENPKNTSNASMPLLLTIPDWAFTGCTNLEVFSTLLETEDNGTRALGPENFILAGDSIFAGLDPTKFHIIIDPVRKQDYLDNASWAPLEKYFVYESAKPKTQYKEYGAQYAYAYENNSIKKEHKVQGHLIEHTVVTGPDDEFIRDHQGAVKLCNDIGVYNNYQLDEVMSKAFMGNEYLRSVSFTDLYGFGAFSDTYTDLRVHIGDSAFVDCKNLADLDLVYMVTDGKNHLDPITPQMLTIGKGVFDRTNARLKMMPQQVRWFEADSAWAPYKDRFMPSVIRFTDEGVKSALKSMAYYDPANTGTDDTHWTDYYDLARIAGAGLEWLDDRFRGRKDIYSFTDFQYFGSVGLRGVDASWFEGCSYLSNIVLPSTTQYIRDRAFYGCSSLKEIELPESLAWIYRDAFAGCTNLNTIIVHNPDPARLQGDVFDKHDGLAIYVPTGKVEDFRYYWSSYAPYIKGMDEYPVQKVVVVTEVGQLAEKLGLEIVKEKGKISRLRGPYAKYDSLTVRGPLNGLDVAVLRFLAGADAYDSDPTDGTLRYLNLWDADLRKDSENSYNGYGVDEYLEKDNWVGEYMFHNCNTLESLVLPKSVTEIGENTFQDARGLKRIAVGRNTTKYTRDLLQNLNGIEELVFLTETPAKSESSDPWEAPITVAFTLPSQLSEYMGDAALTRRTRNVTSLFEEDAVMWALADQGHFFPSEYLLLDNAENIFNDNTAIRNFDEFAYFQNVKELDRTFFGMTNLESVKLPNSIERIGAQAFSNCGSLKAIHLSCDSVPELGEGTFDEMDEDFQILVPMSLCKLYRSRWPQYAHLINPDVIEAASDIITVTLTEPNTLAEALGFTITTRSPFGSGYHVNSLKGDYSNIHRLKVIGPISGADFDVMRYMAGYCPWANTPNFAGHLEYIDLYDAEIRSSDMRVAGYGKSESSFFMTEHLELWQVHDNEVPMHAFLRAYSLKTLILPRTCKSVQVRALQECEGLQTLVVGDDIENFEWSALDDDAMLTRMYILAKKKMKISNEFPIWRWLCNNYNPTFDAFYVRPSLYKDYFYDDAYTGNSWQRTNNISKGAFEDDESFAVFASHAAATADDLRRVNSVKGWFNNHTGARDLSQLGYTSIDSLYTNDMQKLTQLEQIVMPFTLQGIEDGVFANSPNLRYVDMLMCDSTMIVDDIKARGFSRLGIDSLQTLVYLPKAYGSAQGVNIVAFDGTELKAETFRLVDDKDYCVPYAFHAENVENTRSLPVRSTPYTVCLPYELDKPANTRVYALSGRDGEALVFSEIASSAKLEALKPYLMKVITNKRRRSTDPAQLNSTDVTLPPSLTSWGKQDDAPGYSIRGTLSAIDNAEAAELGAYILQTDGNWHPVRSGSDEEKQAYVPAFRTYLLPSARNARERIGMEMDDIDEIRTIDLDGTEHIYDLQGREVNRDAKGFIIHDGKKSFKE